MRPSSVCCRAGSSPRVRGTQQRRLDFDALRRFIPACAGNSATATSCPRLPPVHPRVCGELVAGGGGADRRQRFIPACAGNSPSARLRRMSATVHPRVCGELRWRHGRLPASCGSSPRVRGTRAEGLPPRVAERFIPACAGNSRRAHFSPSRPPVHPRVCGELASALAFADVGIRFIPACAGNSSRASVASITSCGSSPRVRGTHGVRANRGTSITVHPRVCGELVVVEGDGALLSRFIPACAGNSFVKLDAASVPTVHPRVCGELAMGKVALDLPAPVHPRVCGELGRPHPPGRERQRFIPACAGNSKARRPRRPRAAGSSPRVRGTRMDGPIPPANISVHPRVCGELAAWLSAGAGTGAVHPRVCGELEDAVGVASALCGSSPRVRGTPQFPTLLHHISRFIPACAGNSKCRTCWPAPFARFIPACAGNSPRSMLASAAFAGSSPRVRGTPMSARPRSVCGSVHPRVCGELYQSYSKDMTRGGSSPRVRGTQQIALDQAVALRVHPRVCGELHHHDAGGHLGHRFIPACAGNSTFGAGAAHGVPVHPRVCGELAQPDAAALLAHRFIPACAGNSDWISASTRLSSVHPRVCGELNTDRLEQYTDGGSSPRVRGTRRVRAVERDAHRFIPACAGNSTSSRCSRVCLSVHPRVCGELGLGCLRWRVVHRFIPACAGNSSGRSSPTCGDGGSSPRVRGTRRRPATGWPPTWFIPACAGNSSSSSRGCSCPIPVHPRVCGELARAGRQCRCRSRFIPACAGNSPHRTLGRLRACWFIPACAGNSRRLAALDSRCVGSSPRVRGTQRRPQGNGASVRFIPACAGNSWPSRLASFHAHGSSPRVRGTLYTAETVRF